MVRQKTSRRVLIGGAVGLAGSGVFAGVADAAVLTPRAAEGPFYPRPSMRAPDIDNDLVTIRGLVEEAGGEVFILRGRILGGDGRPLVGHRIEIWQCDVNGKYMHTGDRRGIEHDPGFQGFGHDVTDEAGGYVFRTIKPTVYPGRTPHIHVKVFDGGRRLLTTQFYIKDHPNNGRDGLFSRMSAAEAQAVSMEFVRGDAGLEAVVDVIV